MLVTQMLRFARALLATGWCQGAEARNDVRLSQSQHPSITRSCGRGRPTLTRAELAMLAALEELADELGHAPTYGQLLLARLGLRSPGSLHES
jgi:hypothetical protein